ncbi:hypothetical protein OfM1_14740 [Lactovum odontotermitis]
MSIYGYINDNKHLGFDANLVPATLELDGRYGGYPMLTDALYKNPHPLTAGRNQSPENYYLTPTDIKILKKQGFTKNITFEQIKEYFEEKGK